MKKLVFTIGMNGYAYGFKEAIETHKKYSQKIKAEYFSVSRTKVDDPALAAWLKISLIDKAISEGYDYIAYIDADCKVDPAAPDFTELFDPDGESVLMAKGISGRWNSGVIFIKNSKDSEYWIKRMLESITESIDEEHRKNLRFENGNIISVTNEIGKVAELPITWNNTYDAECKDFIRHYTGPFKKDYKRNIFEDLMFKSKKFLSPKATPAPEKRSKNFRINLLEITEVVWKNER